MEVHSKESDGSQKRHTYLSNHQFPFQVPGMMFLLIRMKLLTESQLDIACMAGSKRQADQSYSDVYECIDINCFSLPAPTLNQIESNKARLVSQWYRAITATSVSGESMMTLFK